MVPERLVNPERTLYIYQFIAPLTGRSARTIEAHPPDMAAKPVTPDVNAR